MTDSPDLTTVDAIRAAIEGEEAAVYAYGVAAPRMSGAQADLARGALAAHRLRIVALRELLAPADQPAAPGGFLVDPPADSAAASLLLATIEARLAATYADLAAATRGDQRLDAVRSARESAVRSVAWGAPPEAFPGR